MMFARFASIAFFTVLAGNLSAQPVFRFHAVPEPGMWVAAAEQPSGRSFLGVGVVEISPERAQALRLKEERGVEITNVQEDSPAAKAGLKVGDVVVEYQGQKVIGTEQFIRLVRETPVGRTVEIVVQRDGTPVTLKATIGSRKAPPFPKMDPERLREWAEEFREFRMPDIPRAYMSWRTSLLGVEAESLAPQLAEYFGVKEGVLIRSVLKDSPAEKAGLKAGDVIVKVDSEKVTTPREISRALRVAEPKTPVAVGIVRDRKEMTVNVTLGGDKPAKGGRITPPGRPVRSTGEKL